LSPGAHQDPQLAAIARLARGSMLRRQGQWQAAIADLTRALPEFRALQDLNAEFRCLLEMARAEQGADRLQAARRHVDNALELGDEIRTQTANPEFRASLAATLRDALELRLDLDWRQYTTLRSARDAAAARRLGLESLALADSLRSQTLREWRASERHAEDQRVQQTLQRLAGLRYQLAVRNDSGGSGDRLAQNLRAEIQRERAHLGVLQGRLGSSAARPLQRARQATSDLYRIARDLPKTAFVECWIGVSSAFAWLLKDGQLHWFRWNRPQEIRRQSDAYHRAMVGADAQDFAARKQAAAAVYDLILRPIEPQLRGAAEIVIVPDGPLAQISFAALLDRNQPKAPYLIQRHDLTIAPALTGLRASRPSSGKAVSARRGMLLLADAVYGANDPRLRGAARDRAVRAADSDELKRRLGLGATTRLQRLVWSAREADGLASLLPAQQVTRLQGFDATRQQLLSQPIGEYRFLHMAVHAVVDPEIPPLSGVVLSRFDRTGQVVDAELRMADIANLGMNADLVVLSGCSSASGRSIVGEGVLSLHYAALAGGARGVIATHWEVEDEITARLMTQTYKGIVTGQEAPGRALGLAIRRLLADAPELDPAAWGAFAYYSMLPDVKPAFNNQSGI
jgi:CHAT domain-containing protein